MERPDYNEIFKDIIGLTIEEATPKVADRGITGIRETCIDGEHCIVTCDFDDARLNVGTTGGKIDSVMGPG